MSLEIELPIADLKSVLPGLSKVVSKTSSLPVLGCVRASVENGEVTLQVTNLEDTATVSMGRCGAGSGAVLVPLEELNKAIKGCPGDQCIRLSARNEESLLNYPIGASRADQRLDFINPAEWPEAPQVDQPGIPVTDAMKKELVNAFDCSSEDSSRYILQGAFLDARDPSANYVVGTNGHVLFSANSFQFGMKESLIVPNRKFLHWRGFLEDTNCRLSSLAPVKAVAGKGKVVERPGWVQFKSDRWTFVTRQIEGDYPNWKQVIPAQWKTTVLLSKEASRFILGVVPKMPCSGSADMPIYLVTEKGTLFLSSRANARDAWTTLPVCGAVVDGEAVTVALNRNFLTRAMEFGLDEIMLIDDLSPVLFKKEGRQLVVMVLRLEGSPTKAGKIEVQAAATEAAPNEPPAAESTIEPVQQMKNERNTMTENTETMTAPPRGNLKPSEERSSIRDIIEHIEGIKTSLREVISDLNDTLPLLKEAIKEQKVTEKEIASIRSTLRSLQNVEF